MYSMHTSPAGNLETCWGNAGHFQKMWDDYKTGSGKTLSEFFGRSCATAGKITVLPLHLLHHTNRPDSQIEFSFVD